MPDHLKQVLDWMREPEEPSETGIYIAKRLERWARRRPFAALAAAQEENARMREALTGLVAQVIDYERVNNLAPNPGRKYCWDATERAVAALSAEPSPEKRPLTPEEERLVLSSQRSSSEELYQIAEPSPAPSSDQSAEDIKEVVEKSGVKRYD